MLPIVIEPFVPFVLGRRDRGERGALPKLLRALETRFPDVRVRAPGLDMLGKVGGAVKGALGKGVGAVASLFDNGGILRSGLAFDACDVAVVTNIGEGDHLGLGGIDTLRGKSLTERRVLNAQQAETAVLAWQEDPADAAALEAARPLIDAKRHTLHTHIADPEACLDADPLRLAQVQLSTITGAFSSDDLLGVIFSRFCIGK